MSTTLRLSDILGRGVPIEWYEGVALVREVADRVRDSLAGRSVPELDQVQLSADGAVTLSGATKTDEPVRRLGQLLQACLVQAEPPVQLRLAVAQATAPDPAYPSVREYSDALAYFERPDRPAVLRGLYERAQVMPAPMQAVMPTLDSIAPLQMPEKQSHRKAAPGSRPVPSRRAVAGLAAVVVLVVAATAYSQYRATTPTTREVAALAVKASDAVGTTLVKGISAVSESVGLGRLVPVDGSGAVPPAPRPTPPPVKSVKVRKTPSAAPRTAQSFRIFDLESAALPAPAMPVIEAPAVGSTGLAETVALSPVAEASDGVIYSAADDGVSAPIGVRPQLPRTLPADVRQEQLSQIELIILPDGTVGSVKLLGASRSVLEGMLLSAAKAWKFKPAEKDGRPVTYRKTVWLALQ